MFPCQAVTERRWQKGFATGQACTAIAFVFRKACSRACRRSFALGAFDGIVMVDPADTKGGSDANSYLSNGMHPHNCEAFVRKLRPERAARSLF
jgi:hypothetical protein